MWQKTFGILALGAALAAAGCVSRPAPRPEANRGGIVGANVNPSLSDAVANAARGVSGTGTTEVIVIGNGALVAMQLGSDIPGGTGGQPLTGKSHSVDYPGSAPSGGPVHVQGPGGSVGASPALPGGQISPGSAAGGSPNYTQAVPGIMGDHATQNQTSVSPAPNPGAVGATPMDVMTRVADQIRSQNPTIAEVRFATNPDDARRVADLAARLRSGGAPVNQAEVRPIWDRAIPAGTERFSPLHPAQGTYPPSNR